MRIRPFLLSAFAAVGVFMNVAAAGNIVHGVQVVVIDAGHGGSYPGAVRGDTKEKDLALKVALKLGKLIEEEMPGVKVVYTRKTDKHFYFDGKLKDRGIGKDLQARADIANKARGDIFISIHANTAPSTAAKGAETLIMGESAKEVNDKGNALFENNRDDLIDMSDQKEAAIVRAYIQNLQFTYGEYSMALARCIQNNYIKSGRTSRGVKPQLLKVLYATDMPCVLTEIGFMSNQQELAYMKTDKGQNEIARSLCEAVKNYSAYVLETRLKEEEAEADPKPAQQPVQAVVGKEPARPAETTEKNGGKDSVPDAKQQPVPQSPKTDAPKEKALPDKETPKQEDEPLRYAVQVLASTKPVATSSAQFKSLSGKVKQYTADGAYRYKYCTGEFRTSEEAQTYASVVRKLFPGAFVVKCKGTQIVK